MKYLKRIMVLLCCVTLLLGICSCAAAGSQENENVASSMTFSEQEAEGQGQIVAEIQVETSEEHAAFEDGTEQETQSDSQAQEESEGQVFVADDYENREVGSANLNMSSGDERLIVIDAGHQGQGNSEQEPIGPGASQTKAKVATGTQGCVTGIHESELNLNVALKLQTVLESRGYRVIMIRTSQDVNISNAERAEIANNAGADAFIRVHANSSTDSSVHGAITICQTPSNPYNGNLYSQCRALSEYCLDGMVNATGCAKGYIWETDEMSGINWCQVPVTIVEMGYMSNPEEDQLLAQEDYRQKMAIGIADGVDAYFANY